MKVVVIGMGEVGKHIASVLATEKHDVTIVDVDSSSLARAEEMMDVMALRGQGASIRTLRQAAVSNADLVITASNRDEVNILAAVTAKQLGAKKAVARVSSHDYLDESEKGVYPDYLGIDLVISVQVLTAIEIYRLVKSVGAISVQILADNRVEMIQLPIEEDLSLAGKALKDIYIPENCLIAGILRKDDYIVPSGIDVLLPGDDVILAGTLSEIPKLEKLFGKTKDKGARKVAISGGGEVGFSVAKLLERDNIPFFLIEKDPDRCIELSQHLNNALVLQGDGTDLSLLQQEKMENCDVFVSVTGDDESNLMSCLLARSLGARKTLALVNRPDYQSVYELIGIDATVSPRMFAAKQILKHARQGAVFTIESLEDGKAEVLECVPPEGSRIVGKPLREINFPRGAIIAAVTSGEEAFVPRGNHTIQAGDTVIVVCSPHARASVERMFHKRLFFVS